MNVSISCEKTTKLTLKAAFSAIINANKDLITKSLSQLILRLKSSQQERSLTQRELLILRLAEQYPNDVGIFSALFLNYIRLEPGQALYLSANEPHAYLLGECIECMAASDNVVRAGLTPKYIDTKTLCDMLTYNQGMPEILSGINLNAYTKRYSPPFDEFEMESCMLPIGQRMRLSSIEGPSILIVLGGSGTLHERDGNAQSLQFGDTVFLSAGTEYDVITNPASKGNLQFYRAGVNSRVLLMD
ncbi:hypothetical protein KP509_34G066900 [Ceratopteris richardii]|nr:hypothetical protein KP509_34G066900 [Ceratopteris richardii]